MINEKTDLYAYFNIERKGAAGGRNIRSRQQALLNNDLLFDFNADTVIHGASRVSLRCVTQFAERFRLIV